MTERDSPEPRPTRPGSGDTRLEAIERLRRQLDAIEAKGRTASSGAFDTAPYGGAAYARPESARPGRGGAGAARTGRRRTEAAEPDDWDANPTGPQRRSTRGEGEAAAGDRSTVRGVRRRRGETGSSDSRGAVPRDGGPIDEDEQYSSSGERRSSWGRRREEAPPAPSDLDESFIDVGEDIHTDADEHFEAVLADRRLRSNSLRKRQGPDSGQLAEQDAEHPDHDDAVRQARRSETYAGSEETDEVASDEVVGRRGNSRGLAAAEPDAAPTRSGRGVSGVEVGASSGWRGRRGGVVGAELDDAVTHSGGEDSGLGASDTSHRGRGGGRLFGDSGDASERRERGKGRGRRRSGDGSDPADKGLPGGGTEAQAKDVCLRLLGDRARSRAELADRLAAKGFSPEVANRALDRLAEVGLIDDAAFAEQWVHSRHTFSGKGKRALAQELRRKGVAQEDAEPALESITAEDETDRAAELVRRKLRTLPRDLDREKTIRRLVGMLARRGYNQSTAFTVVKAELADRDLHEPDSL